MLTAHVVRVGGHSYYVDELSETGRGDGRDRGLRADGRGGSEESSGSAWWIGSGAERLGLDGAVSPEPFRSVLMGCDPRNGELLSCRDRVTVSGIDLTFCAPKSVSILAELGPREIATEVEAGHRAAVADAASYLERAAVRVRRARVDPVLLPTTGMVSGAFAHRTSRALDPHLHTHVVAANIAEGIDGRWSALDSRGLFNHLHAGGQLYQARLRGELSTRLGVAWDLTPRGLSDVVGVEPGLRRLFSQRSAAIAAYVAARGTDRTTGGFTPSSVDDRVGSGRPRPSRGMARAAFYATRPEKGMIPGAELLREEWRTRATDCGFDLAGLSRVVGRDRSRGSERPGVDVDRMLAALERCPTRRSLARRDVVAALASSLPVGAAVATVEGVCDRVLAEAGQPLAGDPDRDAARYDRWSVADVSSAVVRSAPDIARIELAREGLGAPREGIRPDEGRRAGLGGRRSDTRDRRRERFLDPGPGFGMGR